MAQYLRHENAIASTETICLDVMCVNGCTYPHCAADYRPFKTAKEADKYEKELKLLGHAIKREPFAT